MTFCLKGEGVDAVHCRIVASGNRYELDNLSEGSGTWVKLRSDRGLPIREGDKLTIDGRLVAVDSTESGRLTFEGIENESNSLVLDDSGIRCINDTVEAFLKLSTLHELVPNDIIRLGSLRFEVHRYNFASASVQGIRPTMEDEDFCRDGFLVGESRLSVFNVYDGHGGFDASKFLKHRFHKYFADCLRDGPAGSATIVHALEQSFAIADSDLLLHTKERGLSANVGAVVSSVVIDEYGNIFCANLGDSRAVLSLADGGVVQLSRDLKPNLPEETERIKRCGGVVVNNRVNGRLAVSRALGDFEYKTPGGVETMVSAVPEIRMHVATGKERFVVLACDGLFDVMTSADAVQFVNDRIAQAVNKRMHPDPSHICVDLVTECVIKRGTTDNVTVVVIFLTPFLE